MVLFSGLLNIITKEVKEMVRDPKILLSMIIVPLLMFPLMGFAVQTSVESAEQSIQETSIAIVDQDQGPVAASLETYLTMFNFTLTHFDDLTIDQAVQQMQDSNFTNLVIIPDGFSQNITNGGTSDLTVYTPFSGGGGIASASQSSVISSVIFNFADAIVDQRIQEGFPGADTTEILNPIMWDEKSIVKGQSADVGPSVLFGLMISQSIAMPVGIMTLLIFAMQLAATTVASEKEEKTLETLLTMPINRTTILAGKLTGSIIVALVGAVAYLLGLSYYMSSFTGMMGTGNIDLAALGLAPTIESYAILGVSLFMALLSALALAISLSVFAEDVRGAQALVGPLSILFIVPMVFTMFTDINALPFPLSIIMLAIPFTHSMLATNVTFTGNYIGAIGGIVYMAIFTIVVLYIASRLFGTEKILTAKLKFKRRTKSIPRE
ncbi:MAG: ABC transporter permease [Candidatus Bathyarchaeota archaeon]|nr:ABC transporter permease [Candidatus Bathyarchaeota archaeon]